MSNYERLYGDKIEDENGKSYLEYERVGHVRKLIINMADGSRYFFNYAHLMDGEFKPMENCIKLTFTTGVIFFRGQKLEKLFDSLTFDMAKIINVTEERYVQIQPEDAPVITAIEVLKTER